MKIGIYSPYLDTMTGGERYMFTAADCLSDSHSVTIFWDNPEIISLAQRRFGLHLSNVSVRKNIFSSNSSLMQRLSKSYDYDVIIYLSDGSIPILAAKKTILHFQFPVEWVESKTLLSKLKLKNVESVVCNSQFTKTFIDRKFSIDSVVIYPPVSFSPEAATKKRENIILTVGRFSILPNGTDYKKQVMLIEAFKKLVDEGVQDWKFVVVTSSFAGGKDGTQLLKEHAQDYPIEILSNVPKGTLDDLYASASIYWHAAGFGENLHEHPDWAEHFGIATVEAMGAGCVPVVINSGGQKEIITDGENGYLWDDEDELLRKTKKLLQKPESLQLLRSDKNELERKFGIERFSKEFHRLVL